MMTWILMSAVAVAAFFYGAYQKAQARKWRTEASRHLTELLQVRADKLDREMRYEGVIASLKSRLRQLEDQIYADADPSTVRALFAQLFPPTP